MYSYLSKYISSTVTFLLLSTLSVAGDEKQEFSLKEFFDRYTSAIQEGNDQKAEQLVLGNRHYAAIAADSLASQSIKVYETKNYKRALILFGTSLKLYQQLGDRKGEGIVLHFIAEIYRHIYDYQKALEYNKHALKITRDILDKVGEGTILTNIGLVYSNNQDYQTALVYFNDALKIMIEVRDGGKEESVLKHIIDVYRQAYKKDQWDSLNYVGLIYYTVGDYQKSMRYFRDALRTSKENNNKDGEADALNNIGMVHHAVGDYTKALESYEGSINIRMDVKDKSAENRSGAAGTLANIGSIYHSIHNYLESIMYYHLALAIMKDINDKEGQAATLNSIGVVYQTFGKDHDALTYYYDALKISREIRNKVREWPSLTNIGTVYVRARDYQRALIYLEDALKVAQESGDKTGEQISLANIGFLYEQQGQWAEAVARNKQSIDLLEKIRGKAGENGAKESFLAQYIDIYPHTVKLLLQLNSPDEAFAYAERGRTRGFLDLLAKANAVVTAGISPELLQRKGDLNKDIIVTQTNLRKQLVLPAEEQDLDLINGLKETLDRLTQQESVVLKTIEEQYPRYTALTNPQPVTLTELQNTVLQDHEILLEYVVTNDRVVIFVVSKGVFEPIPVEISAAQLAAKVQQLRTTLMNPKGFDKSTAYELYTMLFQPVEAYLTGAKIIYIVPDGILYYLPFETLITGNIERNSPLDFLLTKYSIAYVQSASILKTIRNDGRWSNQTVAAQKPLVVFADPVYPEGERFSWPGKAEGIQNALRGQGDNCANPHFAPLPHTKDEAESLAGLYQLDHTGDAFNLREKARESRVKRLELVNYRYVHFATHGVLCDDTPGAWLQSALALSLTGEPEVEQEKGNEGFLQMSEVLNLSLHADLVTLSACQTGLGKNVAGEGLVGLTRAFMYAGTPSVVVSLWSVADPSTAAFMRRFYRHLNQGMPKAAALRQAKRWMLAESYHTDVHGHVTRHDHPFYWAPFILVGAYE